MIPNAKLTHAEFAAHLTEHLSKLAEVVSLRKLKAGDLSNPLIPQLEAEAVGEEDVELDKVTSL